MMKTRLNEHEYALAVEAARLARKERATWREPFLSIGLYFPGTAKSSGEAARERLREILRCRRIDQWEHLGKINPAEHAVKMYGIMIKQGMTHEQALFRAVCIACDEQRGRCAEACEEVEARMLAEAKTKPHVARIYENIAEGAGKAADAVRDHMPPSNLCSDGMLR